MPLRDTLVAFAAAVVLSACGRDPEPPEPGPDPEPLTAARAAIDGDQILKDVETLASDEFEGRLPGTRGEQRTVAYLLSRFRDLGLAPGNPDGSYVQKVPLAGVHGTPGGHFMAGDTRIDLSFPDQSTATTDHYRESVSVEDSDMVFVGYGVIAPEYDWDDYKGLDVSGKTLVMLVNDPPVPHPDDPERLDERFFNGRAMTYYGRWTYKYEIASRLGAAAAVIVHQTGPAGYPWDVVRSSWSGEQFSVATEDGNADRVPVQAWITLDKARELFAAAGQDFDALYRSAASPEFSPVALDASASFRIDNRLRTIESQNVVARLPGRDAGRRDEYIVYTAHWDHLGKQGDDIYNGAVDNATGTAGLLAIAGAFSALPQAPARSVLFMAVTAEEQGLLGTKYYVENPLYPLQQTLANINMDVLNPWGPTRDIVIYGQGQNTLEDLATEVAAAHGRVIRPDPTPEAGFYYRSDHFEFAKGGVPAMWAGAGTDIIGKPEGYGARKRRAYIANDYHKPTDTVKDDWDPAGLALDAEFLFEVGYRLAEGDDWPQWKEGSEFKARRDAMLSGN